jgi:hypothetical protein
MCAATIPLRRLVRGYLFWSPLCCLHEKKGDPGINDNGMRMGNLGLEWNANGVVCCLQLLERLQPLHVRNNPVSRSIC